MPKPKHVGQEREKMLQIAVCAARVEVGWAQVPRTFLVADVKPTDPSLRDAEEETWHRLHMRDSG